MNEIALVAMAAVVGPVILNWLNGRRATRDRIADWARQDEIAARAQKAADDLVESNKKVAKVAAETAAASDAKLNQIHILVNSDMTAARQELLDATRILLALYRKVVSDDLQAGRTPREEDIEAVRHTETKVAELQAILADRIHQQREAEKAMEYLPYSEGTR